MNYQIITDEEKLLQFIEWLPKLEPHEKFYCCLFARSKYTKDAEGNNGIAHIKSDKAQLKRFVSDKERLYWKIKQLEVPLDAYRQREIPIPQESLALYISPNPRNMWKATVNTMVKLAQSIRDENVNMNPHQEALSEIQKSKSKTVYVDFDLDVPKDLQGIDAEDFINRMIIGTRNLINPEALTLLRTRGGLHVLVETNKLNKEYQNTFYKGMQSLGCVDQIGDQLIPVPGTYQGGFTPHFL